MNVLGIMSGTSIDSVDYALCSISEKRIELRELWSVNFPKTLRADLHRAARGELNSWAFCQLHHDLGRFYAKHAAHSVRRALAKPQLVGLHGQTVFHNPKKKYPATFQLGEPAYLVEKLRVPVVNNFRAADLAAGGQGAPLATLFHQFVFGEPGKHVCVNNLGGISNVTSIDWKSRARQSPARRILLATERHPRNDARHPPKILAFDTGPANMLIDFAARHFSGGKQHFDKNGAWAAAGSPSEVSLKRWLRDSYFQQKPPKSTGRERFGEPFFNQAIRELRKISRFDLTATFTEFTARSLVLNYQLHLPSRPDKIILTGGGASNPTLVQAIKAQFEVVSSGTKLKIVTSDQLGWPVQSIEPAAFAWLAFLRWSGQPGNLPQTTGAHRAAQCGQISVP
ncbi:MAG: anhydro-N-acetylmuramic acid kinase [Verrucomicrobiota bacterium]